MVLVIVIVILFFLYTLLLFYYTNSWNAVPVFDAGDANPSTLLSVIIPARNEEKNIGALLNALKEQTYSSN